MKTVLVIIALAYVLAFIPAMLTSIAFWLHRSYNETANMAMKHGFLIGFLSIWLIYPMYLIKNAFSNENWR